MLAGDIRSTTAFVCVVEDAQHGWITPLDDPGNAALATAVALRRTHLDKHLVALHCAVDFIGWNENIVIRLDRLTRGKPHQAKAVAVEIEASCGEVVAAMSC